MTVFRVVQLNFSPEIQVFYMRFERALSIFSIASLKQHIYYFNFWCKIQLDLPVYTVYIYGLYNSTWSGTLNKQPRLHRFAQACPACPEGGKVPLVHSSSAVTLFRWRWEGQEALMRAFHTSACLRA